MSAALAEADRWLRYAWDDLGAAEALLSEKEHTPRHPCWLAQQAAEKALKAALVLAGVNFPKRHDLDALRNLLPDDWEVKRAHPDLAQLTEWAVEARYPGDWPDATESDARSAVEQARAVCQSVANDIDRRRSVRS
jgi:HEPN domain-containing protein